MKKLLSSVAAAFFVFTSQSFAAPMSLNIHDGDLRSTIMLIARTGKLNVAVDDSVKGKISVALTNVEPETALEIIAKTKNIQLIKESDTYIMTAEAKLISPMQSYILPIRYGNAELLRKAIYKSLDFDNNEEPTLKSVKITDKDGDTQTYNYAYNSLQKNSGNPSTNDDEEKDPRAKRIFVNPEVNALVLFGTQAEYERAKKILESLDVELKQVSVEAKIVAIDKDASKNLGIEWTWSSAPQYPERDIEIRETNSGNFVETEKYTRQVNENTGYGILQFGRGPEGIPFEWYYGAKINALVTNGKAKILSRPNVTTIQGREAIINVGSSVPIPRVDVSNSITTTSIEYKDAGIILKYTPRVNADGSITATIHTEVSTPQYVSDLKAYRFNTRSADTTVTVRDGEPMVIGGLIGAEESKSLSKIPFLGDLPILGALFRNHKSGKSESELMIFLTAHVLNGAN